MYSGVSTWHVPKISKRWILHYIDSTVYFGFNNNIWNPSHELCWTAAYSVYHANVDAAPKVLKYNY